MQYFKENIKSDFIRLEELKNAKLSTKSVTHHGSGLLKLERRHELPQYNTLKGVQPILTFATVAKNSDWSFNMGVYENFFLLF